MTLATLPVVVVVVVVVGVVLVVVVVVVVLVLLLVLVLVLVGVGVADTSENKQRFSRCANTQKLQISTKKLRAEPNVSARIAIGPIGEKLVG